MSLTLADEIKKREPFDSLAQEAQLNLMRTHAELMAPLEQLFKLHGISPAKYNILRILRGSVRTMECDHRGLPSLEIAERLITRVPDITRLVDGLEESGLVARTRCTDDRRVVYVGISGADMELLERLDQPLNALHEDSLSHLSPAELQEFNRLLVKARHKELEEAAKPD